MRREIRVKKGWQAWNARSVKDCRDWCYLIYRYFRSCFQDPYFCNFLFLLRSLRTRSRSRSRGRSTRSGRDDNNHENWEQEQEDKVSVWIREAFA